MVTIKHTEISAATAGRLGKGFTAEMVSKTVTEYAKTVADLVKDKLPKNKEDKTLVETPLAAFQVNYKESGIKRNPDGTENKVGPNYTVNVALPRFLLEGINVGVEIIKTVSEAVKKAA